MVEFAAKFYNCNVSEALQKISSFHPQKNVLYPYSKDIFSQASDAPETGNEMITAKQPNHRLFSLPLFKERKDK